ncbi:unnamed protein product [Caenorhabditis auriculariae]|uniref:Uncharacterized protein n=1 Tax=Caenorhabditis auriculariae TaxID=2777116 RepID=A0A8S1H2J8_9PELO|nr:unnamed protein product [Caenorhabditis auriculariae]
MAPHLLPVLHDSDDDDQYSDDDEQLDIYLNRDFGFNSDSDNENVIIGSDDEEIGDGWGPTQDSTADQEEKSEEKAVEIEEKIDNFLDSLLNEIKLDLNSEPALIQEDNVTSEQVEEEHVNEEIKEDEELSDESDAETVICTSSEVGNHADFEDELDEIAQIEKITAMEEECVNRDDLPQFTTRRTVYGLAYNVMNGGPLKPLRDDAVTKSECWVDYAKVALKKVKQTEAFPKKVEMRSPIQFGTKLKFPNMENTTIITRGSEKIANLETIDLQRIIRNAFNARKFCVVLFGVEDDGTVTGNDLDAVKRDNIRLALDTAVQNDFIPSIENVLDVCDANFVPVLGAPTDSTYVTIIRVKQRRNQNYKLASDSIKE